MILHVKDKDAPVREISIEQAKFEFKNNIISRNALCWKIGMKEWVALDQLPEMHDRHLESPKEDKLNENWLNRQLDARRSVTSDAQPTVAQSMNNKSHRLKILAPIGVILMFIFTCIQFAGSAISAVTRSETNAPLLGVLCGMIVFRRLYRLQSEKTALLNNGGSFTGYYFSSSLKSISKWFIYFIPAGIFAFLTGENASEYGTILGTLIGAIICTILLGLDVPIWVWRKKECIANNHFTEKNLAWALTGAISIPLAIYFAIFFMVPSFQRARERAEMAVRINKERAEAEEARKSELANQDATKSAWTPPASDSTWSPPEKDFDVEPAKGSPPIPSQQQDTPKNDSKQQLSQQEIDALRYKIESELTARPYRGAADARMAKRLLEQKLGVKAKITTQEGDKGMRFYYVEIIEEAPSPDEATPRGMRLKEITFEDGKLTKTYIPEISVEEKISTFDISIRKAEMLKEMLDEIEKKTPGVLGIFGQGAGGISLLMSKAPWANDAKTVRSILKTAKVFMRFEELSALEAQTGSLSSLSYSHLSMLSILSSIDADKYPEKMFLEMIGEIRNRTDKLIYALNQDKKNLLIVGKESDFKTNSSTQQYTKGQRFKNDKTGEILEWNGRHFVEVK
jgi:hypothetical protein